MCLTDCGGIPYNFKGESDKIQAERTARASVSVPDRLSKIEDDLAKIMTILTTKERP